MGALKDLLGSERGLLGLLLIIAITILACIGQVSFADWREYTLYVFGVYVVGKTATSVTQVIKGPISAPAPAEVK